MNVLHNTSLSNIQDTVRENALESFEFFANTVMNSGLDAELCQDVQDVCWDCEDDVEFRTSRPRSLAAAIFSWLQTRGVEVVCATHLPTCDTVEWLQREHVGDVSASCVLTVLTESVRVTWL